MLQFLFAADCVVDVCEVLEVHETVDLVAACVGGWVLFFVCRGAGSEAVGDAHVEAPGTAGEDVDPEVVLATWRHMRRVCLWF